MFFIFLRDLIALIILKVFKEQMVDGDPLSTSMAVLLLEPLDNLVDTFSVLVECVPEVSFHLDVERLVLVGSNGEDDVGLVLGLDGAASLILTSQNHKTGGQLLKS